jgi:hypothetical protein
MCGCPKSTKVNTSSKMGSSWMRMTAVTTACPSAHCVLQIKKKKKEEVGGKSSKTKDGVGGSKDKCDNDEMMRKPEDDSSNDDSLPIVVHAPAVKETSKKMGKKKDGGVEKKVTAKQVPLGQVKINHCNHTIKKP